MSGTEIISKRKLGDPIETMDHQPKKTRLAPNQDDQPGSAKTIYDIPHEIMHIIFDHIESSDLSTNYKKRWTPLAALAKTSRFFRYLVSDFRGRWLSKNPPDFLEFSHAEKFLHLEKTFYKIAILNLSLVPMNRERLQQLPVTESVTELFFSEHAPYFGSITIRNGIEWYRETLGAKITANEITLLREKFPKIEKLTLKYFTNFTTESVAELKKFENLKQLDYDNLNPVSDEEISTLQPQIAVRRIPLFSWLPTSVSTETTST